jgi:Putative Ig domain
MCRSNLAGHTRARQALIRLLAATLPLSFVTMTAAASSVVAPTISGTPRTTVVAGSTYSFTPSATANNGGTLSFSSDHRPSWAKFDPTTGTLSGTPTAADAGTYPDISISVYNGSASAALPTFSITVSIKPTISGTPPTAVTAGSAYSFTPSATANNGGTLSFSSDHRPSWTTYDRTTGTLGGTPTAADVGTYSDISISVYNGSTWAALPTFSITVVEPPSGSGAATLDWTPPTDNTDGTSLTNLAGYQINYGTTANDLTQTVRIANPGLTSYMVTDLSIGTWYFAVEAYNTAGVLSAPSNVVSKTIP